MQASFNFYTTMAKQIGVVQYVGKLGQTVGYKNSLSKSTNMQVRAAAASVSNPKTYNQAKQRAKLIPALIFYNAFINIENHAFLPAKKASLNLLRFRSLAMSEPTVPWVRKGESKIPFNVPYKVAEGNLGVDGLTRLAVTANDKAFAVANINLASGSTITNASTVAAFAAEVLANNPNLAQGYELTFMAVLINENDYSQTAAAHGSVVLNPDDTLTTLADVMGNSLRLDAVSDKIVIASKLSGWGIAAGAVIISAKTSTSWRYSNSFLQLTPWGLDGFDDDEELVIRSYMDGSSDITSDKVLQQADNDTSRAGVRPLVGENSAYTISSPVSGATYNYSTAAIVTMSDGSKRVVADNGFLMHYDGTSFEPVQQTVSGEVTSVKVSDTTWSGNNTISTQEAMSASFS